MKIAVDMDDTIVDFFPHIYACVNREFGTDLDWRECSDWDDNALKRLDVFGPGRTWWDWLQSRDWLWPKAPAVVGAIGGLQHLRDMGHRVELLTSKPAWAEWVVWAWAGKWRPPVQGITISFSGQKKHELTDAVLLVDDALHNVLPWAMTGRSAILFDRPWNRTPGATAMHRTFRAKSWADVVRLVGGMS